MFTRKQMWRKVVKYRVDNSKNLSSYDYERRKLFEGEVILLSIQTTSPLILPTIDPHLFGAQMVMKLGKQTKRTIPITNFFPRPQNMITLIACKIAAI